MQDIQYIGEHLLPGRLGHFFILLAFVSALVLFYLAAPMSLDLGAVKRRFGEIEFEGLDASAVFAAPVRRHWETPPVRLVLRPPEAA